MSRYAISHRLPWQNRWTTPTLLQLLKPLKTHQRRVFEHLLGQLDQLEGLDRSFSWFDTAWNWTVQYTLKGDDPTNAMAYIVLKAEAPIVCIPLPDAVLEQLPLRRLGRFVRDGINIAKYAVAIHWATFTPNSQADVAMVTDLVKRKHNILIGAKSEDPPALIKKTSANSNGKPKAKVAGKSKVKA